MSAFKIQKFAEWVKEIETRPEAAWLVKDMIPAQAVVLVSGRQKKGMKSTFLRLVTLCLATGESRANIHPVGARKVLYIDREGAPLLTLEAWRQIARGNGWSPDFELVNENLHYMHLGKFYLNEVDHVAEICRYVTEHSIECVIVDTLAKSFLGDENSAKEMGAAINACQRIQEAGAAVLIVHHIKKGGFQVKNGVPEPDEDVRGSGALVGAYDYHLAMRIYDQCSYLLVSAKYDEAKAFSLDWKIDKDQGTAVLHSAPIPFPTVEEDTDDGFR